MSWTNNCTMTMRVKLPTECVFIVRNDLQTGSDLPTESKETFAVP